MNNTHTAPTGHTHPTDHTDHTDLSRLIVKWKEDPVYWATTVLGMSLDPWQIEFLRAYTHEPRLAVRSARGVGKTIAAALVIVHFLMTRLDARIGCVANSEKQLQAVLWPAISSIVHRIKSPYKEIFEFEVQTSRINVKSMDKQNFAIAVTAREENPEALQGLRGTHTMIVAEEASGVPDETFRALVGSLTGQGIKMVMIGNPTRLDGFFYDAFNRSSGLWWTRQISAFGSPRVTKEWIDFMRSTYGEGSWEWVVYVEGNFPSDTLATIIPRSWAEAAARETNDTVPLNPNGRPVWGFDVARGGKDSCCIIRRTNRVITEKPVRWRSGNAMDIVGKCIDMYSTTPSHQQPEAIYVDAIGVGGPVHDRLKELGYPSVAVNVALSSNSSRYRYLGDELMGRLRDWFEDGPVRIPDDGELIHEMCSAEWEYGSQGKRHVKDKRETTGYSPDSLDALKLTMMDRYNTRQSSRYSSHSAYSESIANKSNMQYAEADCSYVNADWQDRN